MCVCVCVCVCVSVCVCIYTLVSNYISIVPVRHYMTNNRLIGRKNLAHIFNHEDFVAKKLARKPMKKETVNLRCI